MSVKFGCCLMLGSFVPQSAGSSTPGAADQVRAGLSALSRAGYDFAEMTVQSLTRLSEEQFAEVRRAIGESALRVPAFNSFIPGSLKLTGPDASESEQDEYLDLALQRVKAVGGELIVFGSGAALCPRRFSGRAGARADQTFSRALRAICRKVRRHNRH